MGPLPKRKVSRSRRDRRRSHHALKPQQMVECDSCGELRLSHHVCLKCGSYRGEQVIEVDSD